MASNHSISASNMTLLP